MNKMIIKYIINEGYKTAADLIMREADLKVQVDDQIEYRLIIRKSIEDAIQHLQEENADFLIQRPHLEFQLNKARLIQLVLQNKI